MVLRVAADDELSKIVGYLRANRDHLQPWEPYREDSYFHDASWIGAPERDQQEARSRIAFRFRLLLRQGTDDFIGTISLRDIAYLACWNATLGYSLDHRYQGLGLMREAVASVIEFGFNDLNLRRIEACYMPNNVRSERLLQSLHFVREGLLRSSLEVNGKWEDHVICSRINQDWKRP